MVRTAPTMGLLLRSFLLMIFVTNICSQPCKRYTCQFKPSLYQPFVPAPPGHTPRCARPGQTYCETLDHYPQHLIRFLLDECSFNFNSILTDDTAQTFRVPRPKVNETDGYKYYKAEVPLTYPSSTNSPRPAASYGPPSDANINIRFSSNSPLTFHAQSNAQSNHYSSDISIASPKFSPYFNPYYQNVPLAQPNMGPNVRTYRYIQGNDVTVAPRTRRDQNPFLQFTNEKSKRGKRQVESEYISICPTRSQYISPKAALNTKGNWMYVVNLNEEDEKYSQVVRSEICTRDTCDGLCSLPAGYTSRCQQQYVQKKLVALEGSGNRLYNDIFWFPHGCMCQVVLNY